LTDKQWAIIAPLVPGQQGDRGRTGADNRSFGGAILWLARGTICRLNLATGARRIPGSGTGRLPVFGRVHAILTCDF